MNEPTFGEKIGPILEELEIAVLEHQVNFTGERPKYSDKAFLAAIRIFMDTLMDKMFTRQLEDGKPLWECQQEAQYAGETIRSLVFEVTGIDTWELNKNE